MNRIKLFIMDVDGTLTDGKIYMGNDGEVMKAFSAKDGYGITQILPRLGLPRSPRLYRRRSERFCGDGVLWIDGMSRRRS